MEEIKIKSSKVLLQDVNTLVEQYNGCGTDVELSVLNDLCNQINTGVDAVNAAIIFEDYKKILSSSDPVMAAIKKGAHLQYRAKQDKDGFIGVSLNPRPREIEWLKLNRESGSTMFDKKIRRKADQVAYMVMLTKVTGKNKEFSCKTVTNAFNNAGKFVTTEYVEAPSRNAIKKELQELVDMIYRLPGEQNAIMITSSWLDWFIDSVAEAGYLYFMNSDGNIALALRRSVKNSAKVIGTAVALVRKYLEKIETNCGGIDLYLDNKLQATEGEDEESVETEK